MILMAMMVVAMVIVIVIIIGIVIVIMIVVALSRVRSFQGLSLESTFDVSTIKIDANVRDFYARIEDTQDSNT